MELIAPLLVNVVLALVGLGVTGVLFAAISFLRSRTTTKQWDLIESIANAAVRAAEQGKIAGYVNDKKASALKAASAMFDQLGLDISPEVLDAAIEAAVMRAFNYDYHSKYEDVVAAKVSTVRAQPEPASPGVAS